MNPFDDLFDTLIRVLDGIEFQFSRCSLQSSLQSSVDLGRDFHRLIEIKVVVRLLYLHLNARNRCSYTLEFFSPVDSHPEIFLYFSKVEVLVFDHSFKLHSVKRHLIYSVVHV